MTEPAAEPPAVPTTRAPGGIPRIVIVGRPNVGKSTLFNALAGRRVAIEDPMSGVTRDRVSFVLDEGSSSIALIDTGGIGPADDQSFAAEVREQIATALDLADLVLFVVDAKSGLTPADRDVAARLRRIAPPVLLVANKVESAKDESGVAETYTLGFGDPVRVSAKERLGTGDLRELLFARVGDTATTACALGQVLLWLSKGRCDQAQLVKM